MERRFRVRLDELLDDAEVPPGAAGVAFGSTFYDGPFCVRGPICVSFCVSMAPFAFPLEATYQTAFAVMPRRWCDELQPPAAG